MRTSTRFLLLGLSAALLVTLPALPAAAEEKAQTEKQGSGSGVAFTFSGSMGGPIRITDHRTHEVEESTKPSTVLNQSTPAAMRSEKAFREAHKAAAQQAVEAGAEAQEGTAASESAASEAPEEKDGGVLSKEDLRAGLQELRDGNWVIYTSNDEQVPETVYNPMTKQYVSTAEAIKRVRERAEPNE